MARDHGGNIFDIQCKRILNKDFTDLDKCKPFIKYISNRVRGSYFSSSVADINKEWVEPGSTEDFGLYILKEINERFPYQRDQKIAIEKILTEINKCYDGLLNNKHTSILSKNKLALFFVFFTAQTHYGTTLSLILSSWHSQEENIIDIINAAIIADDDGSIPSASIISPEKFISKKHEWLKCVYEWWENHKTKEFKWLPNGKHSAEVAVWAWDTLNKIHKQKRPTLTFPKGIPASLNDDDILRGLHDCCHHDYHLAVYTYFSLIDDPIIREALRELLARRYRNKKSKEKNKGRTLNVVLPADVKRQLNELTKSGKLTQSELIAELVQLAHKKDNT